MLPFGTQREKQPVWRKTSFCASGQCVEVAQRKGKIVLRRSKEPRGISLRTREVQYTVEEWATFLLGVKAGEFDDLC